MLMTFVCLKSAIIYWKLPNHSKCFLLKTSKPFSLCTSCAATLQGTFAEEGSFFNFWSASALWEVRSVNFTPVAVCAKSLIHEICLISSGVPAQSPPPTQQEQTFGPMNRSRLHAGTSGTFAGKRWNLAAWKWSWRRVWAKESSLLFIIVRKFIIYNILMYLISINNYTMNQVWHCVVYCLLHLKSLLSTVVVYI